MPYGYLGQNQPNQTVSNSGVFSITDVAELQSQGKLGGSLELIEEQTVTSTTATLDFTSIQENKYDVHLLQYKGFIPENDAVRLVLRFYENGVLETASVYQFANQLMRVTGTFTEPKSTGNAHIRLGTNVPNDVSSASDNGYIYIYNAGNSSKYTFATIQTTGIYYGDNQGAMEFGGGVLPQASLVNGFQLSGYSSGGIENIETKLFGVKQI
jgi:hypothetical protein